VFRLRVFVLALKFQIFIRILILAGQSSIVREISWVFKKKLGAD